MTFVRLLATAALAGAAGLALAQGAVSPAKKELVQKLLQIQQGSIDGLARGLAEQAVAPLAQQAGAVLQSRVPPEQREATARDVQAEFKKFGDEVVPMLQERARKLAPSTVGTLLEERLSEDELKQVIAMLESPVYKKFQQLAPEMQKVLAEKLIADTRSLVEPKMTALQDALGKRLGLPPRPAAGASGAGGTSAAKPAAAPASAPKKP
jgi:hypothetical protein